jgi:hypothetical protein
MNNVSASIDGDTLTITIDIGKQAIASAPLSSTGKTVLVASTSGAVPVACAHAPLSFSLNVMAKASR